MDCHLNSQIIKLMKIVIMNKIKINFLIFQEKKKHKVILIINKYFLILD